MENLKKFLKLNLKGIFSVKKLSSIVNEFLIKWLLLPSIFFTVLFSFFWIFVELREIKQLQLYYTNNISQHVKSYLLNCSGNLSHVELHLKKSSFFADEIGEVAGAQLSFNAVCLLDENLQTLKSVPENSFKGDFTGLINEKNYNKEFFLSSPYYSIPKNKTSVAMLKKLLKAKILFLQSLICQTLIII